MACCLTCCLVFEVQTHVLTFFGLDVNFGFGLHFLLLFGLRFAVFNRRIFDLAGDEVISGSRGHALGKFATMIGYEFPRWMLLSHGMNLDAGAIKRPIVRAVGSPENKSEVFFEVLVFFGR